MGLCLVGRHPIHSEGGYSHGLGQNATFAFLCPCSSGLAPRSLDGYLLMNSLVIGFRIRLDFTFYAMIEQVRSNIKVIIHLQIYPEFLNF